MRFIFFNRAWLGIVWLEQVMSNLIHENSRTISYFTILINEIIYHSHNERPVQTFKMPRYIQHVSSYVIVLFSSRVFGLKSREYLKRRYKNAAGWNANINSPAFNGLGTPPTKTVFLGSNGNEASSTKSASLNLQGRIWTGLSLMVGLETHKYSLSSSWMQASIKAWTDDSSWKEIKYFQFLENTNSWKLKVTLLLS